MTYGRRLPTIKKYTYKYSDKLDVEEKYSKRKLIYQRDSKNRRMWSHTFFIDAASSLYSNT